MVTLREEEKLIANDEMMYNFIFHFSCKCNGYSERWRWKIVTRARRRRPKTDHFCISISSSSISYESAIQMEMSGKYFFLQSLEITITKEDSSRTKGTNTCINDVWRVLIKRKETKLPRQVCGWHDQLTSVGVSIACVTIAVVSIVGECVWRCEMNL